MTIVTPELLERHGLTQEDIDRFERNFPDAVRECHGFAAHPVAFVMERVRLSEQTGTQIKVVATVLGDDPNFAPLDVLMFMEKIAEAVGEMTALHRQWVDEGEDWPKTIKAIDVDAALDALDGLIPPGGSY